MDCPNCQLENPENVNFCYECGHNFHIPSGATLQTLSFNEKIEKIQRYLPRGLAEKILNQKDKIEGERKLVTVMFCDMENFSFLVERLGPEEAYYIMDQIYEILIHTVHEFEGIVNEMTGDGIMALFGAPIALENAPHRALWSALSIHREIAGFSASRKEIGPIKMRIGIHTGPVVVGSLGNDLRVEFKAVGNTVNLASHMEKMAEAGTTCVTEETFRQTKELFRFKSIGKKLVKGKRHAIPVYQVVTGKKDVYRPRLGSERIIYSEMIGRDKQLDRLELQVMKVINGEGSVVNIIGEAGIGKSRLVAELKKRDIMRGVNLFEGRAISIGRNLCFHPIIDVLKQWAQIREDDSETLAFGKLEVAVRKLHPEAYIEVLPFVGILMGMKPTGRYAERIKGIKGEALEKLILKNVRELLIKATEVAPLVLVLEDLHWADTSSLDLMESLFRLGESRKILFINIFRPGYQDTSERIIKAIKDKIPVHHVQIVLDPLDKSMSEVLITNMLKCGGSHHDVVEQIVQRTGGNPFFIEEVVGSLIDQGAVVPKKETFQVTERIGAIAIPNTINDVLMARIDRLEGISRDLLKIASVIGRNFFHRILTEVADTVDTIGDKLAYLKEIHLICERDRMGELEYFFKHALTQEAAYESVLPLKRKQLHLKVAKAIEKVFDERLYEFYGMLAYHYSKGENFEKTEEYLIKAGNECLKSSASNEALHYYQEALSLYLNNYGDNANADRVAMFEMNIAMALYNRGQYLSAVEYFDKSLSHYWGELPKNAISKSYKFLSGFLSFIIALYFPSIKFKRVPTQKDNEIFDLFLKKCKSLSIINPKRFFIETFYYIKRVANFKLTKFELGLEIFMGASTLFSFTGLSFRLSRKILNSVKHIINKENIRIFTIYELVETIHNYLNGDWKGINNYNDHLVNKNLEIGEIYSASQHLYWHGCVNICQGSFDMARLIMNRLEEIDETYENDLSITLKYLMTANLRTECRELHKAKNEVETGIDFIQTTGFGISLINMNSYKAMIHLLLGDIEEAKKSLQMADEIISEVNPVPILLTNYYRTLCEYFLFRLEHSIKNGRKPEILDYREKTKKSAKRLVKLSRNAARNRTESYKLIGIYYWLMGKQKKALRSWSFSILEGERLGAYLELSRTYFEVGKRLLKGESKFKTLNGLSAEQHLDKARALFQEMGLQWDLDKLDLIVKDLGV